jgi:acyl-CoA synthetase
MTGDLAQTDEAGNFRIVGRIKDLIIRGGHNIHPAKIENYAMRHVAVVKAAAFPVADERLGERICLAVVLTKKRAVEPLELLRHLDELGLSRYEMPEYFVELDQFPLTASGKILKRTLVDLVMQGAIKPEPVRRAN